MIDVFLPLKIESVANKREHWAAKAKRTKIQRTDAYWAILAARVAPPVLPCVVTLTRIAPRTLDDDNLSSGFKAVRDGIADWLGIDDRDSRVKWRYEQRKGAPKEYAARIQFLSMANAPALFV